MASTRGARTRAAVVAAAREAFARDGYEGATGAAIAAAAGVSEPTIAFHFGSKAGLLVAVLDDYYDHLVAAMDDVLDAEQDPLRRLEAFACWWVVHNIEHVDLLTVFGRHGRGRHAALAEAFTAANRRVTRTFDRLVDDAKRAGVLCDGVPTSMVRDAFFGGAEHLMIARATTRRTLEMAGAARQLLDLLVHGAAPRPAPEPGPDPLADVDDKLDQVLHLLRTGHDL